MMSIGDRMKYVIDVNRIGNDCSFCPCFERDGRNGFCCILAINEGTGNIPGIMRDGGDWWVCCFDRPDWCPLVPYDEMVMSEWVESVNSQPLKNEPKETVRVELYKSEIDKLGRLAMANGLSTAQMVAKLIEEYE